MKKWTVSAQVRINILCIFIVLEAFSLSFILTCQNLKPSSDWEKVPEILQHIKIPEFPDRDFNIMDFGAVGDGTTDNTDVFARAVDA